MLGSSLVMERDLEGKLYVNGKQVITRDVMASNGVLHVIDGVLIPETARSFSQLLSSRNLTEFSRIVEATGKENFFKKTKQNELIWKIVKIEFKVWLPSWTRCRTPRCSHQATRPSVRFRTTSSSRGWPIRIISSRCCSTTSAGHSSNSQPSTTISWFPLNFRAKVSGSTFITL